MENNNEKIFTSQKKIFKGIEFTVEDLEKLEEIINSKGDIKGEIAGTFTSLGATLALASGGANYEGEMIMGSALTIGFGTKLAVDGFKFKIAKDLYKELKPQFDEINQKAYEREQKEKNKQKFKIYDIEPKDKPVEKEQNNFQVYDIEPKDELVEKEKKELKNIFEDIKESQEIKRVAEEVYENKRQKDTLQERKNFDIQESEYQLEQARQMQLQKEKEQHLKDVQKLEQAELNYHKIMSGEIPLAGLNPEPLEPTLEDITRKRRQ